MRNSPLRVAAGNPSALCRTPARGLSPALAWGPGHRAGAVRGSGLPSFSRVESPTAARQVSLTDGPDRVPAARCPGRTRGVCSQVGGDSHVPTARTGTAIPLCIAPRELPSFPLDKILHVFCPAQQLHQPLHAVDQVPQLDHVPAARTPGQGPHHVPVHEQSGHRAPHGLRQAGERLHLENCPE